MGDIADHEQTSALRRSLEQVSSDAGAKLLRALGLKGDEAEMRSASDEFGGHCLALTLLGSYLTDAYYGDIRCRGAGEDPRDPGCLDTHPLIREYFGEQLRSQRAEAWKEANRRLYDFYRALAPQLPDSVRDMESLFLAVICGCQAGLFRDALHEVYVPRIQRGDASFAARVLGDRGALLSVLVHFFEHGRWGSPVQIGGQGQSLTPEDQLFILTQARMFLTATRGFG